MHLRPELVSGMAAIIGSTAWQARITALSLA